MGPMASQGTLQAPLRKRRNPWCVGILCAVLAVTACKREAPDAPPRASGPGAAVTRLAEHLRHNELRAFARDAVPAAHFIALEAAWRRGDSRWPLTELPLDDQIEPMLAALGAPDATRQLKQSFDRNLANQGRDLREAANTLGSFGLQYVEREGDYSDEERAHYVQVIGALREWARQAPLGDPARAEAAISKLVAAARTSRLTSENSLQAAGMEQSLVRLEPFFAACKTVLASYGLMLDRSLDGLRVELIEERGANARVRIRYPLAAREVTTVLDLERHAGRWYLAHYLRLGEQALQAQADAERDAKAAAEAAARIEAQAGLEPEAEPESAIVPADQDP